MVDEVKDAPQSASPEANRILADALKAPMVSNYRTVVKDLKAPELKKREAVVPEKSQVLPVGTDYMAQVKPSLDALKAAEESDLVRQADLKLEEARMEGDKYTKLSDSAAQQKREILADPTRADYRQALEEKAKPFVPHEENAQDLMALFGLLNVVGFAIGSGGKEYSQAAMSAMNGMLEGHQKGREDLYKKEKSIFETNQKQLDSRIKQLLAFMQDTELLSGMDKTARDQAIEGEFLRNKADTLKKFYETRGYGETVKYLDQIAQASQKAATLSQQEKQRAAKEDFDINKIKAEFEGNRQRDADAFANQISLKQQELEAKAAEAYDNRNFELSRDLQNRAFTLATTKANYVHAENLAKINRDHADTIELARKAEAAGDRAATAEYRKQQQKLESDRLKETERHDRAIEALRVKEIAAKGSAGSDTASDVKNFLGVNFGSGKQADAKYDQAAAAANTSAEALALSNIVRKSPDVVGRVGQAKGFIDRYVKSLSSDGLETDKTPVPTNRQEQEALLFSKRYAAYLIRYEQALAGSAKGFTVSFMNRFNNLMQQNQFNAEGFDGLMKEQIREIAAKSAVLSTKITPENLMRLGVAQTRDPDAIEAFGRMQGGGGTAPAAGSSVDAERSRAKAAIAAGAPEAAVKARFKEKTGKEL